MNWFSEQVHMLCKGWNIKLKATKSSIQKCFLQTHKIIDWFLQGALSKIVHFTVVSLYAWPLNEAEAVNDLGCRDGTVVRALASHQCGPDSIPRSGVICGLSLLVLFSAPIGFFWVLRFTLSSKNLRLTWFVLVVSLVSLGILACIC